MDNENKAFETKAFKLIEDVAESIKSLKTKADADASAVEDKMKDIKSAVDLVKATHDAHSDTVKNLDAKCKSIEKSIEDLDMRTKGSKHSHIGTVSMTEFSRLHKEMGKEFAACKKTDGASAVTMTMKTSDFANSMNRKANNMTEPGNFGGSFVIAPDRLPGYFAPPLRPIHIREFINQSITESNIINYSQETEWSDGSGSTAQGSAAGQSDFTLTAQQVVLQKINSYFTIAKEMLEDTPVTENYIRTRGVGRLLMFEDVALLTGNGVAPNQYGINPVAAAYAGLPIPGTTPTNINYYDVLMEAVTQAKVSYYRPNYIIVHPNDYNTILLSRDTYGRYQFMQNIEAPGAGGFYIGGALLVENTAQVQGTFTVGDFEQGATMFTRDEVEITFSNQHVDNFIKGYVTVMVEERIANAIYRPSAFITGNFTAAIVSGS